MASTVRGIPRRRVIVYLVIGALAVVAYAVWMSGVQDRRTANDAATQVPATERPVVSAKDGAVVPAGTDVVSSLGRRYWSPSAAISVGGGVLVVSSLVTAPQGDPGTDAGVVVVPAPTVLFGEPGAEREPWRTDGAERRTRPGGTVGFSTSFDDVDVEVGDTITLRLVLDDGSQVEYDDVEVLPHRAPTW